MKNLHVKHSLIPIMALIVTIGMSAFRKNPTKDPVKEDIVWNESLHNFGDIPIGPDATCTFVFQNKSKKTVVIQKAEPGCSCTVSDFTSNPVKKNKKGKVTATYKTEGKPGFFKKYIHVVFADGYFHDLAITGNVVLP